MSTFSLLQITFQLQMHFCRPAAFKFNEYTPLWWFNLVGGSAPHSHSLNLPLPSEMGEKTEKTKLITSWDKIIYWGREKGKEYTYMHLYIYLVVTSEYNKELLTTPWIALS